MFKKEDCFKLGTLVKTHGTDGRIILTIIGFEPREFDSLKSLFVDMDGALVPYYVSTQNRHGMDALLIGLEDINSPDKAKKLLSKDVYVPLNKLPKQEEDAFYAFEIASYEVIDKSRGSIGKVIDILELPKNPLLRIEGEKGEILIPLEGNFIISIDKKKRQVLIDAPDKLIDLNT
ncbi:MAG: ribosome maturation factor RimM [Bacteroidales bacterium]|jgi:16S rRNA processing protein RimM|nr:ribosome maturation factor RimM [Bacteroidales bacterium]